MGEPGDIFSSQPYSFLLVTIQAPEKRGAGSSLPGFGVSPKNPFSLFLLAAVGGKREEKRFLGTPQAPAEGWPPSALPPGRHPPVEGVLTITNQRGEKRLPAC